MTAVGRAYDAIKTVILNLDMGPGTRFSETELSVRLGIGRTPVREALAALRQERLVDVIPRSGYVVSPVTVQDVHELFQIRRVLEVEAVGLACEKGMGEAMLAYLRRLAAHEFPTDTAEHRSQWLRANTQFHTGIARASGNARLADVLEQLFLEMERLFRISWATTPHLEGQHERIVEAILSGNVENARSVARDEVNVSLDSILSAIMSSPSVLAATIGA